MAKLSTFNQQDYSLGLNDTASPLDLKRGEASYLRNWDITYQGQLHLRPGLTQAGDTLSANAITGLHSFIRTSGSKDLLAMEGANLKYLNGSTWDTLDTGFTPGMPFWLETVSGTDEVYISNEDNTMHSWDRASVVTDACLTDLGAAVPHGNISRWHKNHLFTLNNVNVSGTKYPNRIYWSDMGDPTTWDTTNNFFEIPGDGRAITAVDLGNSLVLFKERAIQYLSGWGNTDWQVTATSSNVANIDERIGCIAPRGATRVGNEIWFIDNQGIIRRIYQTSFDAFRRDIISTKLQGTLATLNENQLAKVSTWTHNDKVFFALPTGTSTTSNLVCVYDIIASGRTGQEAWTIYEGTGWTPSMFTGHQTSSVPDLYIGDATTGQVYRHIGTDDLGDPIVARWDGKQDDFNSSERWKRYKFGYISGVASGSASVSVYASVDGSPFADLGDLVLAGTGSRLGPTGSFHLGPTGDATLGGSMQNEFKYYFTSGGGNPRGKSVLMSVRYDGIGSAPVVNTHTVHFKPRNLR
jgi:hypothetical protein